MKYVYLMLITLMLLIGCKSKSIFTENIIDVHSVNIDKTFDISLFKQEFKIESASITDSILTVNIIYKGIESDKFTINFNGSYMKSLPPIAQLFIVQETDKSQKHKEIKKILKFDISSLKYQKGKKVYIKVNDFEEKLTYTY